METQNFDQNLNVIKRLIKEYSQPAPSVEEWIANFYAEMEIFDFADLVEFTLGGRGVYRLWVNEQNDEDEGDEEGFPEGQILVLIGEDGRPSKILNLITGTIDSFRYNGDGYIFQHSRYYPGFREERAWVRTIKYSVDYNPDGGVRKLKSITYQLFAREEEMRNGERRLIQEGTTFDLDFIWQRFLNDTNTQGLFQVGQDVEVRFTNGVPDTETVAFVGE